MPWLDVLVGVALLVTAGLSLAPGGLFRAVIMFIVFGLVMALAWVRLAAPDIALAEAAIGAGITGVLLLDTLGYLRNRKGRP
jgi:energy-converting hydrogenase B subunit D